MWKVRWLSSITEVDRAQWDSLAPAQTAPILEYRWLHALEESGSITPATGWQPCHLTLWEETHLIGAAPLYVKYHSDGEFVFDHWLAQLAAEKGIDYYPKLVGMSPATPAVGYRFLTAADIDESLISQKMLAAIDTLCRENGITGCHLNFVDESWYSSTALPGFTAWQHQSYLWRNPGCDSFDDYLALFKSSARRNIRRELQSMDKQRITIRALSGDQLTEELATLMYRYYLKTNKRYGPWAARFLYGDFFSRIFSTMPERLLLMAAYIADHSIPVGLSLLLFKEQHLIGRYWGGEHARRDLHFNMCYYQPLRWAIDHRIATFDPGAGSPHKIARGFQAVANTSLHRFYDPRLALLFSLLIERVNQMNADNIIELNGRLPFAHRNQ